MTYIDPNATVPVRTLLALREEFEEREALWREKCERLELLVSETAPKPADHDFLVFRCKRELGLTYTEACMLLLLMRREVCSEEALDHCHQNQARGMRKRDAVGRSRPVAVHIWRMRNKLAEHAVVIETVRGCYTLPAASKSIICSLLNIDTKAAA